MTEQIEDDFWAQERARAAAERGRMADPGACGTCKTAVAAGGQVVHDECAQRALLLPAPDAPGYELITGMSEEEVWALPARFHIPAFVEPVKAWVCAVCWGDGWSTQWPCKTAVDQGLRVFTADDYAETRAKREAAELAEHRAEATTPLVVSRFDVAMEAALEEEPGLTIGAIAENGRPVALVLDEEARAKVAGWLVAARPAGDAEQALTDYATTTRTVTADDLAPYLLDVKAEAILAEWERLRPVRQELDRVRANRDYWRTRYRAESHTTWSSEVPPGGEVCADCGEPAEAEPCAEHNPAALVEQLRAEVEQWRATYGADALPGALARLKKAEDERDEARAELARYVGHEPTIAEEMAYLSRCLDAVHALCDEAGAKGIVSGGTFTVDAVRQAADGIGHAPANRPALPWAHVMDDADLHEFLGDLVSAALGRWRFDPDIPDRTVLADLEKVCADWRTPGKGLRSDEPEAGEGQ